MNKVSKNFLTSLEIGESFERECITMLSQCGHDAWKCADAKAKWDLEFNYQDKLYKVECKQDHKSIYTGNVFFETYYNNKPSGINNPEPDYWMHGIAPGHTLLFNRQKLVEFLQQQLRSGGAINKDGIGDDGKSDGILVKVRTALICPDVKEFRQEKAPL